MSKQGVPEGFMKEFLKSGGKAPEGSAPSAKGAPGAMSTPYAKRGIEIRDEYHEQLRRLAYWERKKMRDLIDEALKQYLDAAGPTEPIPDS